MRRDPTSKSVSSILATKCKKPRTLHPKPPEREFIDYKTSMITEEDLLQGLLFY